MILMKEFHERCISVARLTPFSRQVCTGQARSQDLERGGSFSVSAARRIGVCDPNFPAGVWGAVSPPAGSGAVPRKQMHFDNNLSKICLKSGLACKKSGGDISYGVPTNAAKWGEHAPHR